MVVNSKAAPINWRPHSTAIGKQYRDYVLYKR